MELACRLVGGLRSPQHVNVPAVLHLGELETPLRAVAINNIVGSRRFSMRVENAHYFLKCLQFLWLHMFTRNSNVADGGIFTMSLKV